MSTNHADILKDRARGSRADHGELSVMADQLEDAANYIEELKRDLDALELDKEELLARLDLIEMAVSHPHFAPGVAVEQEKETDE